MARLVENSDQSRRGDISTKSETIDDPVFGSLLFARVMTALRVSHAQQYSVRLELKTIATFLSSLSSATYLRQFSAAGGFESVLFVLMAKRDGDFRRHYDTDCASALALLCQCVHDKDNCKSIICTANGVEAIVHCLTRTGAAEVVRLACTLLVELGAGAEAFVVRNAILALLSCGTEDTIFAAMKVAAELSGGRSDLDDQADCLVMPAIDALRHCGASTLAFAEDALVSLISKCTNKKGAVVSLLRLTRTSTASSVTSAASKDVVLGVLGRLLYSGADCLKQLTERYILYTLFRILVPRLQPGHDQLPHRTMGEIDKVASILSALHIQASSLVMKDGTLRGAMETMTEFYEYVLHDHARLEQLISDPSVFARALGRDVAMMQSMRSRLVDMKWKILEDQAHDDVSAGTTVYPLDSKSKDAENARQSLVTPDCLSLSAAGDGSGLSEVKAIDLRPPVGPSPSKHGIKTSIWQRLRRLKAQPRQQKVQWNRPDSTPREFDADEGYKAHMERIITTSLEKGQGAVKGASIHQKPRGKNRRRVASPRFVNSSGLGSSPNPADPSLSCLITQSVNVGGNKGMKDMYHM